MAITNDKLSDYKFLAEMYSDGYFPDFLVDKGQSRWISLACRPLFARGERPD